MINVTGGIQKFHAGVIRQQIIFERRFASSIRPILKDQMLEMARSIESGDIVLGQLTAIGRQEFIRKFIAEYARVGRHWFDDSTARIAGEKRGRVPQRKDAEGLFAASFDQWLELYATQKIVTIIEPATLKIVKTLIEKGIRDGKSFQQIAKDIEMAEPTINGWRSKRIANTETHIAMEKAVDDTVKAHSLRATKDWNAFFDERTRDAHVEANAQRGIPKEDPFIVGGEELMHPGDPNGSASMIINCRCVATYHTF